MWECHIEYLLYKTQMILMENKNLKWYVPSSKIKKQGEGNGQRELYNGSELYLGGYKSISLLC